MKRFSVPHSFDVKYQDILSVNQGTIRGDDYIQCVTQHPRRRFILSSVSYSVDDIYSFKDAIAEVQERVRGFRESI